VAQLTFIAGGPPRRRGRCARTRTPELWSRSREVTQSSRQPRVARPRAADASSPAAAAGVVITPDGSSSPPRMGRRHPLALAASISGSGRDVELASSAPTLSDLAGSSRRRRVYGCGARTTRAAPRRAKTRRRDRETRTLQGRSRRRRLRLGRSLRRAPARTCASSTPVIQTDADSSTPATRAAR